MEPKEKREIKSKTRSVHHEGHEGLEEERSKKTALNHIGG